MKPFWQDEEARGGPSATVHRLDDLSMVGEVRRACESLAADAELGDTERGSLAIIVTELATNLARHARKGRILLSRIERRGAAGIEVLALDEGPGIPSLARAFEDGYSTGGSAGKGLGAIRRLSNEFDLYSRPGEGGGAGTICVARVWAPEAREPDPSPLEAGVACVPLAGERVCGDGWAVLGDGDRTLVAVADGLGHGPDAAVAATEALRVIRAHVGRPPAALIQLAHGALRPTRGAAVSIASIDHRRSTVTFAGVGNVSAVLLAADGGSRTLVALNGTVGHAMRSVQDFHHPWPPGGALVMHSDGINTRWRMDAYPGLMMHAPSLIAGALFRDSARGRDDATVVALRERTR